MWSQAAGRCQMVAAHVGEQVLDVGGSRPGSMPADARAAFSLLRCLKRASDPCSGYFTFGRGVGPLRVVDRGVGVQRRGYRSDLSDERWALIEPVLTAWRAARVGLGISRPVHDLREIVNAILYVARTGIAWEYLPHDLPPAKTVYDYYAKWEADGATQRIHHLLRERVRVARGRRGARRRWSWTRRA